MTRTSVAAWGLAMAMCCAVVGVAGAAPVGTAFTYQGELSSMGSPYTGLADFAFILWAEPVGGAQAGGELDLFNVPVENGLFTVKLDFGVSPYAGEARWLQISVRAPAGAGTFTDLTPRQELTPAPFSIATRGIRVDAQDNITLPLSQPQGHMTIDSPGGVEFIINADTDDTGGEDQNARIVLKQDGGLTVGRMGFRNNQNHLEIINESSNNLVLGANNQDVMTITSAGRVGIGAASPTAKMQILASDNTQTMNVNTFGTGQGARIALTNFNNVNAALTASTTGSGPALTAIGSADDTPAIRVDRGSIKVAGAGIDSSTFCYVLKVTEANLVSSVQVRLDHPQLNGNPNAMIFITYNESPGGIPGTLPSTNNVSVFYASDNQRWLLTNSGGGNFKVGDHYNILIFVP